MACRQDGVPSKSVLRQGADAGRRVSIHPFGFRFLSSDVGQKTGETLMVSESTMVYRLFIAKGLRAFGDGFVSLLLPLYLVELGFTPFEVGIVATITLIG